MKNYIEFNAWVVEEDRPATVNELAVKVIVLDKETGRFKIEIADNVSIIVDG